MLTNEDKAINYNDTKFSYNIYKTLKKTGYIDTVNVIFKDANNTLILEGNIKKINTFTITGKYLSSYYKSKIYLTWYIKNTFGEILDSLETTAFSGEFSNIYSVANTGINVSTSVNYDNYYKMVADAIDISYINLHKTELISNHIKKQNNFKINDPILNLKKSKSIISDKLDASMACVTVKVSKDKKDMGHGSGFAISEDGYIITNYHVIASEIKDKPYDIKIILSNSKEYEAKVIRVNKYRDVALLKIEGKFEKAFTISSTKSFRNMQDIYTIGTPKSVELGQTVSSGIISNERTSDASNLLQLSMSVNSGNSGGPVFDSNGNLHGIIVAKLIGTNTEGVSFAIPTYLLEDYLNLKFN